MPVPLTVIRNNNLEKCHWPNLEYQCYSSPLTVRVNTAHDKMDGCPGERLLWVLGTSHPVDERNTMAWCLRGPIVATLFLLQKLGFCSVFNPQVSVDSELVYTLIGQSQFMSLSGDLEENHYFDHKVTESQDHRMAEVWDDPDCFLPVTRETAICRNFHFLLTDAAGQPHRWLVT